MKKILIISELYKKGGAGNATANIFIFLKKQFPEMEINLLIPYLKNKEKNIFSYYNLIGLIYYFLYKSINRIISLLLTTNKFYFFNKFINKSLFKAHRINQITNQKNYDYIIVLWFEYILNYKEILSIKDKFNAKIILFPFDMFNFTGGCRYAQLCTNFKIGCKNCPALLSKYKNLAQKNYELNKLLLSKIRPTIISPSNYANHFINQTNILNKNSTKKIINYPVPEKIIYDKVFYKILKDKTKNKKVIFLGAQDLREWRKGILNFLKIISKLKFKYQDFFSEVIFISVGKNSKKIFKNFDENIITYEKLNLKELYSVYKVSDLIIIPSLQEWGSLMMSEVFNLEKTIFAFDTGSSRNLILNNINGYIFKSFEHNKVAKEIYLVLSTPDKFFKKKKKKFFNELKYKYDIKMINKKYKKILGD